MRVRGKKNCGLGFVSLNPIYDLKLFGSGLAGLGKSENMVHFEAMFSTRIYCFSAKMRQSRSFGPFSLNSFRLTT